MCHLCESAEHLFEALHSSYDDPRDALHVLTVAMYHCICAMTSEKDSQCHITDAVFSQLTEKLVVTHKSNGTIN